MRTLSALILLGVLSGCYTGMGNRSRDWWVPVNVATIPNERAVVEKVRPGAKIESAFAFGRQGTLVCGTDHGQAFNVYVDERGRIANGEVEDNPCPNK